MPRGHISPPEQKAAALRQYLQGRSVASIGRALGISRFTVARWIRDLDPAHRPQPPQRYRRDVEELGQLVYDTVVDTLTSLRARAVETGRPEWIRTQTAGDLAALDIAQWDRVIRVISAFRPATQPADDEDAAADDESGLHRNGAVDSTD